MSKEVDYTKLFAELDRLLYTMSITQAPSQYEEAKTELLTFGRGLICRVAFAEGFTEGVLSKVNHESQR